MLLDAFRRKNPCCFCLDAPVGAIIRVQDFFVVFAGVGELFTFLPDRPSPLATHGKFGEAEPLFERSQPTLENVWARSARIWPAYRFALCVARHDHTRIIALVLLAPGQV